MNPIVVLKLLDLAMLGFTGWGRYREAPTANREASDRVAEMRRKNPYWRNVERGSHQRDRCHDRRHAEQAA
jgi:hypothetical protein